MIAMLCTFCLEPGVCSKLQTWVIAFGWTRSFLDVCQPCKPSHFIWGSKVEVCGLLASSYNSR